MPDLTAEQLEAERESFWQNRERLRGNDQALDLALDWIADLLSKQSEREEALREALDRATRYIAEQEGDWDMAGRFRVDAD